MIGDRNGGYKAYSGSRFGVRPDRTEVMKVGRKLLRIVGAHRYDVFMRITFGRTLCSSCGVRGLMPQSIRGGVSFGFDKKTSMGMGMRPGQYVIYAVESVEILQSVRPFASRLSGELRTLCNHRIKITCLLIPSSFP